MDNAIPLSRGLGSSAAATVGGVVAGAALARAGRRAATRRRGAAPDRLDHRVAPRQRGRRPAGRVRRLGAARRSRGRDPVRRAGGPAVRAVHPRSPAGDRGHAPACCPSEVPLRHAVENLGRVAIGVAGIAIGPVRAARRPHRRPPPRAVPLGRLPGAAAAHDGRARGGRAGRVPVGRRVDDPRVRRARARTRPRSRRRSATRRPRAAWPGGSRSWRPATTVRGSVAGLTAARPSGDRLRHRRALDLGAVRHRHGPPLDLAEAVVPVQRHARERRDEDQPGEARPAFAAASQASRIRVPSPWRVRSGRVNIARTRAASVDGSMIRSSSEPRRPIPCTACPDGSSRHTRRARRRPRSRSRCRPRAGRGPRGRRARPRRRSGRGRRRRRRGPRSTPSGGPRWPRRPRGAQRGAVDAARASLSPSTSTLARPAGGRRHPAGLGRARGRP